MTTKIGCHVGMNSKELFLGSAKEAVSYGADLPPFLKFQ